MQIEEKYIPIVSRQKYFDDYFDKYSNSILTNDFEFLCDFFNDLQPLQIDKILSKYSKSPKAIKLICEVENWSDYVDIKLTPIYDEIDNMSYRLTKAERIRYLIYLRNKYTHESIESLFLSQTKTFYNELFTKIDYEISRNVRILRTEVLSKNNPDATDVLDAYLVLDRKQADNIFYKAQIEYDNISKFDFEVLLDDWLLKDGEKYFFPNVNVDGGIVRVNLMNVDDFKKHLLSFDY